MDEASYVAWFRAMVSELVEIFGEYAHKLVFTGEDFPYSVPDGWDHAVIDHLPRDAVAAGMGIRNGITENFDSYHNAQPAYGAALLRNGHVALDETWHAPGNPRIFATENECYDSRGIPFPPQNDDELLRAIALSNVKALQVRNNWIFVSTGASYLDRFPEHWRWVTHSLGHRPQTAFDAWAVLREARDRFWVYRKEVDWLTRPWARNMERWLVQKEVCPDGVSRRGSAHVGDLFYADSVTYEGRRSDISRGQQWLYFDADPAFLHDEQTAVDVKVTFLDVSAGAWRVEYDAGRCVGSTDPVVTVGDGMLKTATFAVPDGRFADGLPGGTDLRIGGGDQDIEVRMVRMIKTP